MKISLVPHLGGSVRVSCKLKGCLWGLLWSVCVCGGAVRTHSRGGGVPGSGREQMEVHRTRNR